MNKMDFTFYRKNSAGGHEDYWFIVTGDTQNELTDTYMEMCMRTVDMVVYSKDEDIVGVRKVFPFNYSVSLSDDPVLKSILVELTSELEEV